MEQQADISEVRSGERKLSDFRSSVGCVRFSPQELTDERINWFWQRVESQDYAFDDFSRGNKYLFCQALLDPSSIHFFIEDSGWCVVRNLNTINPDIHFCIWSRATPIPKIKQAGVEVISWVFENYSEVTRVTAMVPDFNEVAKKFAIMLRFQFEGCMKDATLYKGRHWGVSFYGLLRSYFMKGRVQ